MENTNMNIHPLSKVLEAAAWLVGYNVIFYAPIMAGLQMVGSFLGIVLILIQIYKAVKTNKNNETNSK